MNYYNENDPKAAAWLRELVKAGIIAPGIVDERSIVNVQAEELAEYCQCHFFAGIGGWSYALRLAGWSDDKPAWTGSCPCQPFSDAGNGLCEHDERHLWPDFRNLIGKCRPAIVFGEQVASTDAREWLAGVSANLEALAYRLSAADLCAAGVKSPHRRQRLFWVAHTKSGHGWGEQQQGEPERWRTGFAGSGAIGGLSNPKSGGCGELRDALVKRSCGHVDGGGVAGRLVQSCKPGLEGHTRNGVDGNQSRRLDPESERSITAASSAGAWDRFDVLPFKDGKQRRVEAGTFPLAHGVPGRVGLLRGYGNAIVPHLAAEFIQAAVEAIEGKAIRHLI